MDHDLAVSAKESHSLPKLPWGRGFNQHQRNKLEEKLYPRRGFVAEENLGMLSFGGYGR